MAGGITILLIAAVGVGYFLYHKFNSRNRDANRHRERTEHNSLFSCLSNDRRYNANVNVHRPSTINLQSTGQANRAQASGVNYNRPLVPASRENITETGPMLYFANDRHGQDDKVYKFNYKKVGGGWRAYILRTPSLRGRNDNGSIIHRLHDDDGYYVCWDRQVDSLKDMQTISRRWADSIQEYISTGRFG